MDTNVRPGDADELAIERYRYLLRTAPPETLEAVHAEAFAQLTPEQRARVLEGLSREVDPSELSRADDSPEGLARLATRAELRRPGTMERAFADQGRGGGGWFGGGFGGSFFGMLAGAFVGTSIANAMFAGDVNAADAGAGDGGAGDGDPGAADGGGYDDGGRVDGGGWDQGGDPGGVDDGGFGGFGDGGFDGGGFDIGF